LKESFQSILDFDDSSIQKTLLKSTVWGYTIASRFERFKIMADLEELIKINKKKREAGLPEVKVMMRVCLCCQKSFAAIGRHERICKECKAGIIKRGTGIRGDVV